jgi:hypothetical protein
MVMFFYKIFKSDFFMPTVSTSIKIDAKTKKEAQELFKDMGMSLTTAINIFLKQAVRD